MVAINRSLFSWDDVENLPDLKRLSLVLNYIPDEKIVQAMEKKRGNGRDDFPVRPMWNAVIAGIVFQHESIESLIRELSRNPKLLTICGFDPIPVQRKPTARIERNQETGKAEVVYPEAETPRYKIPSSWNFSRFLENLIELEKNQGLISNMVPRLREELMKVLPDFGKHLGYDGKAIKSHSTGQVNKKIEKTSDPDADWGKHETAGVDSRTGKIWKKTKTWFGYTLHLIADTQYEIPVSFSIAPASVSEYIEMEKLIKKTLEETLSLPEKCQDFCADRGLDSGKIKAFLWDDHKIRPMIPCRELWREEKKNDPQYDPSKPVTRSLFPNRVDTIVYTEKGTVHCVCPKTGIQRDLAFQGFEDSRNTLKYRCPAAAYGFNCKGKAECHCSGGVSPGEYGRIVRINITKENRRIFVPTPFDSPSWDRGYNRRSSLERINSRLDNDFCFEKHYIRGKAKMQTRMGLSLAVMMAMALGHIKEGRKAQMRSLVKPLLKAA